MQDVTGAGTALRLLSVACAIVFDAIVFLVLFSRLSGTRAPWRGIIRGALFGAVGFEVLKQIATILVGRTTANPVYGTFAVLVGLMVWINLASRFALFAAAWTATRRVVLTVDARDPENCADPAEAEALQARAEAGKPKDETSEDEPAEDEPSQDQKASSAY
jgi:membrane protein